MKRLMVAIVAVALALVLAGCGGGGGKLIGADVRPPVTEQNFAWGERAQNPVNPHQGGVHGQNFAWGEYQPCGPGTHEVSTTDPITGEVSVSCEPNDP